MRRESRRWIEGSKAAAERLAGAAQVVVACDQEGDLWAHFARRPEAAELLVRARHDREPRTADRSSPPR